MVENVEPVFVPGQLPLFPLVNQVLLPTALVRLQVSANSRKSTSLVEHLSSISGKELFVGVVPLVNGVDLKEQDASDEWKAANMDKLSTVGTAARVLQLSRLVQTGDWTLVLEGVCRISVASVSTKAPDMFDMVCCQQLELRVQVAGTPWAHAKNDTGLQESGRQLKSSTRTLLRLLTRQTGLQSVRRVLDLLDSVPAWRAADVVASALSVSLQERHAMLLAVEPKARVKLALQMVQAALEIVRGAMPGASGTRGLPANSNSIIADHANRRGPSSTLAGEDGEDGDEDEVAALGARLRAAKPPPEVLRVALRELRRLRSGSEGQPGHAASRAYLEVLAELPWARLSTDAPAQAGAEARIALTLRQARDMLDKAHYGLDKVKERIIQYLAVLQLKGGAPTAAPVLCFIGPPGVGKTSLARSVAAVLRRPLVRIALGGVRDEAEVRGHRRTYVGAMPGRIIQGLRRARVRDPVVLLDEVDKMGRDMRGDPASALLEVLDPEQNSGFTDTYLGLPFDLSAATFVATANRAADIPPALLDRLEVVELAGYTLPEKLHIARRHLLPKVLSDHGLSNSVVEISDDVVEHVAEHYTREAGVRSLGRCLAAICRHVAAQVVDSGAATAAGHEGAASGLDDDGPVGGDLSSTAVTRGGVLAGHGGLGGAAGGGVDVAGEVQGLPGVPGVGAVPTYYGSGDVRMSRRGGRGSDGGGGVGEGQGSVLAEVASGAAAAQGYMVRLRAALGFGSQEMGLDGSAATADSGAGVPEGSVATASQLPVAGWAELAAVGMVAGGVAQGQMAVAGVGGGVVGRGSAPMPRTARDISYTGGAHGVPYPPDLLARPVPVVVVTKEMAERVLGPARYQGSEAAERVSSPGAAAGLVWTAAGGMVQYIECVCVGTSQGERPGQLTLTGQVGDVLEESAHIALSWIRAHAAELDLDRLSGAESIASALGPEDGDEMTMPGSGRGGNGGGGGGGGGMGVWPLTAAPARRSKSRAAEPVARAFGGGDGGAFGVGGARGVKVTALPYTLHRVAPPGAADGLPGADPAVERASAPAPLPVVAAAISALRGPPVHFAPSSLQQQQRRGGGTLPGFVGVGPPSRLVLRSAAPPAVMAAADGGLGGGVDRGGYISAAVASGGMSVGAGRAGYMPTAVASGGMGMGGEGVGYPPAARIGARNPALCWDVHVHLPAGAVPKDGPSAGITLAVAMLSLLSGRCVRADTAMTGELTLRGLVLPVGGIKDKLLAARRAGLARVIVPARNMREVEMELPAVERAAIEVVPATRLEDVLAAAFDPPYCLNTRARF